MSGHGTPRVPVASAPSGSAGTPFRTSRTELIASQVLPAAGAPTSEAFAVLTAGAFRRLSYWISYTRGAAGGYPVYYPQWSNGTDDANELLLDQTSLVVTAPVGKVNLYQEALVGPAPDNDNPLVQVIQFEVPAYATGARILVAEEGDTVNPGTIAVAWTLEGWVV